MSGRNKQGGSLNHLADRGDGVAVDRNSAGGNADHSTAAGQTCKMEEPEVLIASTISYFIERQLPEPAAAKPLSQLPKSNALEVQKSALKVYEDRLRKARWLALSVGSFYRFCMFLALCSLTWATVVLLGAFVPDLRLVDYSMVTSLLVLEAIRLATAAFFTILLTHGLSRRSQDPTNILQGRDDHYRHALFARLVSTFLQALLIAPSFVCPIVRYRLIQYENHNLHHSIFIFYVLILINAFISSIALFCSSAAFIYLRDRHDQSILRYYDEVVQNAISTGVIQADDFGFFHFSYKLLGGECARILKPEAVVKNHRKLVAYLYQHRLGQDFLLIYLDANDAFIQLAAVSMAGFWGDSSKKVGIEDLKVSKEVLTKMADKVAIGQVGWGAINSFVGLAKRDASILAKTRTSSGMLLLDRLVDLVVQTSGSSCLTNVRALVHFYHHSLKQEEDRQEAEIRKEQAALTFPILQHQGVLVQKLKELLTGDGLHRLRAYSAYLLHLMGKLDPPCYALIEAIDPTHDRPRHHWLDFEQSMLGLLIQVYHLHLPPSSWPIEHKYIRPDY